MLLLKEQSTHFLITNSTYTTCEIFQSVMLHTTQLLHSFMIAIKMTEKEVNAYDDWLVITSLNYLCCYDVIIGYIVFLTPLIVMFSLYGIKVSGM